MISYDEPEQISKLKIISGGQTGVDRAALYVAKLYQLPTGGWLPKHCMCQDGNRRDLLDLYNMTEHSSVGYPPRTKQNVWDADATLRYAENFKSAGEKLTLKAIKTFNKPYFDIHSVDDISAAIEWIKKGEFKILNCAGNSENTVSGIYNRAVDIFTRIFSKFGTCPVCNGTRKIYGERLDGPVHLSETCGFCDEYPIKTS